MRKVLALTLAVLMVLSMAVLFTSAKTVSAFEQYKIERNNAKCTDNTLDDIHSKNGNNIGFYSTDHPIGCTNEGDTVEFLDQIDFGSKGATSMTVFASNGHGKANVGILYVYVDSIKDGNLIATIKIEDTGDFGRAKEFTANIVKKVTGTHTIFFKLGVNQGSYRWFSFTEGDVVASPDPTTTVAPTTVAPAKAIKVLYQEKEINFGTVKPVIENGTTLVPLRAIFEALGATVDYANGNITAKKGDTTVKLTIGQKEATVNGKTVTLSVPAKVVTGSTLVPLRFIGESFGNKVDWNATTQTITIS